MAIWTESSFVQYSDTLVPESETRVVSVTWPESDRFSPAQSGYAPGHGPGVATTASSSTLVSKSLKPRRR